MQEIDAAAMSIWISYKHYEGGVDCAVAATACANGAAATATKLDLQDLNLVKFGALINF